MKTVKIYRSKKKTWPTAKKKSASINKENDNSNGRTRELYLGR